MSEQTQNLGTLTWFAEGGFYWLDGELTNQLQLYPVQKMAWDDGITDHSGAPEKLVFGDVTFTKLYEDDNVYQTDIFGDEGAYSLMDIDGTGYYTGFMGGTLRYFNTAISISPTTSGGTETVTLNLTSGNVITGIALTGVGNDTVTVTIQYLNPEQAGGRVDTVERTVTGFEGWKTVTLSEVDSNIVFWSMAECKVPWYTSKTGLYVNTNIISGSTANDSIKVVAHVSYTQTLFFERLVSLDGLSWTIY